MKDALGRDLRLGDKVAVTSGSGMQLLLTGVIVKFTPKACRVLVNNDPRAWKGEHTVLRTDAQICLVEHNPALEAELTNPTAPVDL